MIKEILQFFLSIIAYGFKAIAAVISLTLGLIADLIFNHKDKDLLSQKEYLKAKNRRAEKRVNKYIDSIA